MGAVPTNGADLDGNAIAGVLLEIFSVEMTTVESVCGGCGARAPVGALAVYVRAPGVVVRCRVCGRALIRVVRGRDRCWVDLSGVRSLEVALGESALS